MDIATLETDNCVFILKYEYDISLVYIKFPCTFYDVDYAGKVMWVTEQFFDDVFSEYPNNIVHVNRIICKLSKKHPKV